MLRGQDIFEQRAELALISIESAVLAGAIGQAVKVSVSRPYPYMYGPAPYSSQNSDGINYASFWSGHSAVSMAAATSAMLIFWRSGAPLVAKLVVCTLAPALSIGAGIFEITAGNHFPSDVVVGVLAGGGIGVANLLVHDLDLG